MQPNFHLDFSIVDISYKFLIDFCQLGEYLGKLNSNKLTRLSYLD